MLSQYGIVRDGDWELTKRYDEYVAIHKCEQGAFSWEKGSQWTAVGQIRVGGQLRSVCMGCGDRPPATMQGLITFLEWER